MLRVLEVCTTSSPAYALVFDRAQALQQRYPQQLTIDLLCSDGKEVTIMRRQGMRVITADLHRSLNPWRLLQSTRNLQQVLKQQEYDVVHLHFGVPSLVGRLIALWKRRPVWIYQSHGYSIAANTSRWQRFIYLTLERWLKNTVQYALFQSHEDLAIARKYHLLDEAQMIYLGNGVNTRRFSPQPDTQKNQQMNKVMVFGMVARFETIKNHQLLLDAIKYLRLQTKNFKVYLIGQGTLQPLIQTQILAHELQDQVEILAFSHDMPAFYQRIDVAVLTSFAEGLPRALLEPMACGKPVLSTDVKGSREVVRHQQNGFLVRLGDPQGLARRMLWCLRHPEALPALGAAAREHVLAHYDEQQVLERLAQLYLQCADAKAARQSATQVSQA